MQNAITVGAFVPREFSGAVFSVHDHAINIRDDNDYRLVSIVDREMDLTGLSVLVSRLPGGVGRGEAVTIAGGRLSISATRSGAGTAITFLRPGNLPLYSGSIPDVAAEVSAVTLCSALPLIREAVLAHGSPEGLRDLAAVPPHPSSPFARRALDVIDAIGDAEPPVDLSGLVGLGIGFTPSGDDFIMGFLAAGAAADLEAVRGRLRGTTLGGATLLRLALDGSFPSYMCEFVDGLRVSVPRAVIRAARHGETSGTDALAGFVCGLTTVCAVEKLDE